MLTIPRAVESSIVLEYIVHDCREPITIAARFLFSIIKRYIFNGRKCEILKEFFWQVMTEVPAGGY